jgi:hypothetical protein
MTGRRDDAGQSAAGKHTSFRASRSRTSKTRCPRSAPDARAPALLKVMGASSSRGLARLWVSAEGAVDHDLVQSALEEGELMIIERVDEQVRDPACVDRRGFG